MARRTRPVRKLLDEPLKLLGVLTLRSCAWTFVVYSVNYFGLELGLHLWSSMFGSFAALIGPIAVAAVFACALGVVESYEDQHTFMSAVRFYSRAQGRIVYSAGCPDGATPLPPAPGDSLLALLRRLARRGRPPAYEFHPRPLPAWLYAGLWRRKEVH